MSWCRTEHEPFVHNSNCSSSFHSFSPALMKTQMYLKCRWEVHGRVIKRLRRWLKLCITNESSSYGKDQPTMLHTVNTRNFGLWSVYFSPWKMPVSVDNIIATFEFASIAVYYFKSLSSRREICSVWLCLLRPHLPYGNLLEV